MLKALGRLGYECHFINHNISEQGAVEITEPTKVALNVTAHPETEDLSYLEPFTLYVTYPPNIVYKDKYNVDTVIFDSIDEPEGIFRFWNLNDGYNRSLKEADILIASAKKLYDKFSQSDKPKLLLPNAVDLNSYPEMWRDNDEYRKLWTTPIIGYSGSIATWVDQELIKKVALAYPETTVILIGAEMNAKLIDMPKNVKPFGHVPPHFVPYFIGAMDVCLIPFKTDDPVMEACNPLKLWEYFAYGKPVVSTAIPETRIPGVYWAESDEEFISKVGRAMSDSPKLKGIRTEIAKKNTWDIRAKSLAEVLGDWNLDVKP